MTILCGTDFSEQARMAAIAAASLGRRMAEPVRLVHVLVPTVPLGGGQELLADVQQSQFEGARDRLGQEAERVRELGVEVREDLRVTFGPPDEALVTAAQEQQARLLVLGHVGRRLPARWLLGSVAESVARSAPVPVLTVRDSDPWVEWAEGRRPLRVVVGVEFSPASKAALSWAGSLARWGPCQLVVVHAYWPPEERQRRGLEGPSILGLNAAEVETPLTAELQAMLAECLPTPQESARLRVIASWGRIADDLVRAAEEEHADLVVVGAHRRGWAARLWYGSVSSGVLHLGHGTVAVVPGPVVPSTT